METQQRRIKRLLSIWFLLSWPGRIHLYLLARLYTWSFPKLRYHYIRRRNSTRLIPLRATLFGGLALLPLILSK